MHEAQKISWKIQDNTGIKAANELNSNNYSYASFEKLFHPFEPHFCPSTILKSVNRMKFGLILTTKSILRT